MARDGQGYPRRQRDMMMMNTHNLEVIRKYHDQLDVNNNNSNNSNNNNNEKKT